MELTPKQKQTVTDALNTLGVALADHDHKWTLEQRSLYQKAIRILK
jgi:hypothetical protein